MLLLGGQFYAASKVRTRGPVASPVRILPGSTAMFFALQFCVISKIWTCGPVVSPGCIFPGSTAMFFALFSTALHAEKNFLKLAVRVCHIFVALSYGAEAMLIKVPTFILLGFACGNIVEHVSSSLDDTWWPVCCG